jgi:hypothetical protein
MVRMESCSTRTIGRSAWSGISGTSTGYYEEWDGRGGRFRRYGQLRQSDRKDRLPALRAAWLTADGGEHVIVCSNAVVGGRREKGEGRRCGEWRGGGLQYASVQGSGCLWSLTSSGDIWVGIQCPIQYPRGAGDIKAGS